MSIELIICFVLAVLSFVLGRYIEKEERKNKVYLALPKTKLGYFMAIILCVLVVSIFLEYPSTWCLTWLFFMKVVDRFLYLYRKHLAYNE